MFYNDGNKVDSRSLFYKYGNVEADRMFYNDGDKVNIGSSVL